MNTRDIVNEILEQDIARTRRADERQFFQILRAVLCEDAFRPGAPDATTRDVSSRPRNPPSRPASPKEGGRPGTIV